MNNRKEIAEKIPHGYGKVIAQKAGVSKGYVSKWFTDETINSVKVENAVLEVLEELAKDKQRKNSRLQSLMNIL